MSTTSQRPACGFIGLGSQGAPMARRMIDAGYPTLLWARRPASLEPFAGTSATTATSVSELGAKARHVGVCVVDDAGVVDVCDELIAAMQPGSLIAIHATVHPATCQRLADRAAEKDIALIDAPVSGGGVGAEAGTLTVMVGGAAAAVAEARPVFETFGKLIVHLGGVGAGQAAKLVNNNLMAANLAMAHQAMTAGDALGVDRQVLAELLRASSGRSFALDIYANLPAPTALSGGALLLEKDVNLLDDLLRGNPAAAALHDAAMPFIALARGGGAQ